MPHCALYMSEVSGIWYLKLEMIHFLLLALLLSSTSCSSQTKLLDDLQSDEDKNNFDSFPLVSRTVTQLEECEGVSEVSEVRDVRGELVSKLSLLEHIEATPVTDTLSGASHLVTLRYSI